MTESRQNRHLKGDSLLEQLESLNLNRCKKIANEGLEAIHQLTRLRNLDLSHPLMRGSIANQHLNTKARVFFASYILSASYANECSFCKVQ